VGTTLRTLNEQRCERLLSRSALLDTSDLAWHDVGATQLDAAVLACLVYMRDVEAFTRRYLSGLAAHPATLADPLIARFLPIWKAEEGEHARALGRFLHEYGRRTGEAVAAMQSPPPTNRWERSLVLVTRPIGHVVTAAHMTWGAANELLTMTGYRLLARRVEDPVLAELLGRIAAQESRHYGFYRLQAEWRLQASGLARRLLPHLMRKAWTPVGIGDGFKSVDEFDRVLAFLLASPDGHKAITAMDGAFTRLPGFEDLPIYHRAVTASCERLGATSDAVIGADRELFDSPKPADLEETYEAA
jgi:hypothetical protein